MMTAIPSELSNSVSGAFTAPLEFATRPGSLVGGSTMSHICGRLELDRLEAAAGENVRISWDFSPAEEDGGETPLPSERDWIGLFQAGEGCSYSLILDCLFVGVR